MNHYHLMYTGGLNPAYVDLIIEKRKRKGLELMTGSLGSRIFVFFLHGIRRVLLLLLLVLLDTLLLHL